MVPKVGFEPTRCRHRGILSPVRLPVSPLRLIQIPSQKKSYNTDFRLTKRPTRSRKYMGGIEKRKID